MRYLATVDMNERLITSSHKVVNGVRIIPRKDEIIYELTQADYELIGDKWATFNLGLDGKIIDITPIEPSKPEPTPIEKLQQENQLLKAQNKALQDKADFHEDVLAEIILELHS